MYAPTDTIISEDNIRASKTRYEAMKAVKSGRATPEQLALLRDLDAALQRAIKRERR